MHSEPLPEYTVQSSNEHVVGKRVGARMQYEPNPVASVLWLITCKSAQSPGNLPQLHRVSRLKSITSKNALAVLTVLVFSCARSEKSPSHMAWWSRSDWSFQKQSRLLELPTATC